MSENGETKMKIRVFEFVISAVLLMVSSITGWTVKSVIEHGNSLAAIQASRFTASDGVNLYKQMTEMSARIPSEFPPSDYKKMMDERYGSLDRRVQAVENNLDAIAKLLTENRIDIQAIRSAVESHKDKAQ